MAPRPAEPIVPIQPVLTTQQLQAQIAQMNAQMTEMNPQIMQMNAQMTTQFAAQSAKLAQTIPAQRCSCCIFYRENRGSSCRCLLQYAGNFPRYFSAGWHPTRRAFHAPSLSRYPSFEVLHAIKSIKFVSMPLRSRHSILLSPQPNDRRLSEKHVPGAMHCMHTSAEHSACKTAVDGLSSAFPPQ